MVTIDLRHIEETPPVKKVFRAASSSRAGMFHYTFLFEDGNVDCSCEGWKMNRKCWHIEWVQVNYGGEADDFEVSL